MRWKLPPAGLSAGGGDPFCAEAVGEYDAPIFLYDTLESSNRTAKTLALEGAPPWHDGACRPADGGPGTAGAAVRKPGGERGVYLSLVLRPSLPMTEAQAVTVSAAVAVCRAVKKLCGLELGHQVGQRPLLQRQKGLRHPDRGRGRH